MERLQDAGTRYERVPIQRPAARGEQLLLASLSCSLVSAMAVVGWDSGVEGGQKSLQVNFQTVVRGLDLQDGARLPAGSFRQTPQLQSSSSAQVLWPVRGPQITPPAGFSSDTPLPDNLTNSRGKTGGNAASR